MGTDGTPPSGPAPPHMPLGCGCTEGGADDTLMMGISVQFAAVVVAFGRCPCAPSVISVDLWDYVVDVGQVIKVVFLCLFIK